MNKPSARQVTLPAFYLALSMIGLLPAGEGAAAGIKTDILTISGEVTLREAPSGPVIVEVYTRPQLSPRPLYSAAIPGPGPYEVRIRPGTYYLRAFVDENKNRTWDIGEPTGIYAVETPAGAEASRAATEAGETVQALTVLALASKKGINIKIDTPGKKSETERESEAARLKRKR